jgi:hypothetical protein
MPIKHVSIKKSINRSVDIPVIKKRLFHKKDLFKIAGCLSSEDAAEMKAIIEQGCERIDHDAWKNLH